MTLKLATLKISKPAHRALLGAGIETLEQLTQYKEEELLALHGFGPKGLRILKEILTQYGLSFRV